MRHRSFLALTLILALCAAGCGSAKADVDPKAIEKAYGLTGAYVDQITTQDGTVDATIVPTTLEDGRRVQLVIPHKQLDPDYKVYMREGVTITPVALADPSIKRQQFVSRPVDIERRSLASEPVSSSTPVRKKRSTKDEILIVGGSAGGGAAIGALAGGKKGAAVGAVSGGIAGLVYDLATRNKK